MMKGDNTMKRLSLLTLVFAILSVVFILLLIFFRFSFTFYPLMSYQDALDLLTPLVLIPVYWLLFKYAASEAPSVRAELAFMVLAALWVLGHGMHLASNSIDNLIEGLALRQVVDVTSTSIYQLTYFFDEHLGHIVWHAGMLSLPALIIYREAQQPANGAAAGWVTVAAGLLYGFLYFCIFIEGQTVALGLPCALALTAFGLITGRRKLAQRPVLAFFFVACALALLLFAGWGLYWRGFPQFTDVGLI
jgi:hypothetical protein